MAGLEGSPSRSLLLDIQQIPADLRLAQLIRRPSVMLGQAAHRLLINLLCLVGQSTQLHVLDHTGAQRCHRLLLRRRHTGGTTPPRHRRIASPASLRPCRHSLRRSRSVQRWTYWRTSSHDTQNVNDFTFTFGECGKQPRASRDQPRFHWPFFLRSLLREKR